MIHAINKKIKTLRSASGMTQADLARRLNITRASVNAWEMGVSNPSTEFVIEMAKIFGVSTDYLLDMPTASSIDVQGLAVADVDIVYNLIKRLREKEH